MTAWAEWLVSAAVEPTTWPRTVSARPSLQQRTFDLFTFRTWKETGEENGRGDRDRRLRGREPRGFPLIFGGFLCEASATRPTLVRGSPSA